MALPNSEEQYLQLGPRTFKILPVTHCHPSTNALLSLSPPKTNNY